MPKARRARSDDPATRLDQLNREVSTLRRQLRKTTGEIERLHRENNRLIGMAAHDLRTPLTAIKFYSQFLLTQPTTGLSQQEREFVSIIHTTSDFMSRLVNDLLDVSRIESGGLKLNLAPVDLTDLVSQSVALLGVIAGRRKISIELSSAPLPSMILDGQKVRQVLENLVGNALKFSPPGSKVSVSLRRGARGGAQLRVSDQGPGIPEEEVKRVFRPFERSTARALDGERSSGLGLAIVKRIVEGHHGTIRVESTIGAGTTFVVELPMLPLTGSD